MNELVTRTLTGAIYVGLTLGAAWAGPVTTSLLFLPVCLQAAYEMHRLSTHNCPQAAVLGPMLAAAVVYITVVLTGILPGFGVLPAMAVLFLVVFVAVVELLWRPGSAPALEIGPLLMVVCLVAVPFGLISLLMRNGPELFIGFMLLLWTNDTGAYLVGKAWGRTPLLPRTSPKKTIEGLVGGILLAMAIGLLLAQFWAVLSTREWLIAAAIVAITSTVGDLLESALKREAGVKDSGDLLPGHGGVLDRFDGFLLALPAMVLTVAVLH